MSSHEAAVQQNRLNDEIKRLNTGYFLTQIYRNDIKASVPPCCCLYCQLLFPQHIRGAETQLRLRTKIDSHELRAPHSPPPLKIPTKIRTTRFTGHRIAVILLLKVFHGDWSVPCGIVKRERKTNLKIYWEWRTLLRLVP